MRTQVATLCAMALLMGQTTTSAQKTEVSVKKGKVIAETETTSVAVEAGRKAVLALHENPIVTVNNPFVSDVLQLHKLIEQEKKHSDLKIDSAFILVGSVDVPRIVGALYFEFPNFGSEATKVLTLPSASIIEGLQVYDMKGNLCRVDMKIRNESTASYSVYVNEPIQPGEHFKLIGVADLEDIPLLPGGAPAYWKEGPLWYFRTINNIPNCLNYFRLILPKSAILIDSNRPVIATDSIDGKVAVTIRNYTGKYADGLCMISVLWPERDGTSLADIPAKYHGLRSPRDKQNSEMFRDQMRKIKTGAKPTDQSTPLTALLTCFGSIVHEDIDLHKSVKYTDRSTEDVRRHMGQAQYWADILDLLSTPEWPDNPGNGYVHPIYVCRRGSMICEFTQPSIYHNGKWYDGDTKPGPSKGPAYLTAEDIAAAKREGYLCDWEVAGPYVQKGKKGTELFDVPFGPEVPGADVPWQPVSLETHDQHPVYINLDRALYHFDHAVAYLRTEIVSDKPEPARLEIYTDDGVKAWFNGELVHTNNIARGIPEEPDTVAVTLQKGNNHLMLKVTDDVWSWGAIIRLQPVNVAEPEN